MTTEEKINLLQAQIDELRKEVKPKLEVGKWYWIKHTSPKDDWYKKGALICYQGNSIGQLHYGFNFIHEYINDFGNVWQTTGTETVTPATDKEVEEALIKEAERRGFKEGGSFKPVVENVRKDKVGTVSDKIVFFAEPQYGYEQGLASGKNWIFYQGKWAEIIKDEPIKLGGYEISKKGEYYYVGCKTIGKELIDNLQILMQSQNFKKVAFDGIEVDLDTIERILKL